MSRERWRFVYDPGEARLTPNRRVIEVECEATDGFNLTTGEPWVGTHVKARFPLINKRWKRSNLVGVPINEDVAREAVERAAVFMLHGEQTW
jgi:hypothetical protein